MDDPRESGDPRAGTLLFYGLLGVLVTILLVLTMVALYYRTANAEAQRKLYGEVWTELRLLRARQEAELNSYRWIDKQAGVVGIPIERGMELVVRELQAQPGADGSPGPGERR